MRFTELDCYGSYYIRYSTMDYIKLPHGKVALHRKGPERDLLRCLRSIGETRSHKSQSVGAPIEVLRSPLQR
jgi:hypothetical protein